jgi:hypothetical protein
MGILELLGKKNNNQENKIEYGNLVKPCEEFIPKILSLKKHFSKSYAQN